MLLVGTIFISILFVAYTDDDGWAPIYGWLAFRRKVIGFSTVWGKYIHVYLLIAGLSLVVDVIDTVRYLIGDDGSLYLRWNAQ